MHCTSLQKIKKNTQTKPHKKLTTSSNLQQQNLKQSKNPNKQKIPNQNTKNKKKGGAGKECEREALPLRFLLNSAMRQNAPFPPQPWAHTRLTEFWTMSSCFTHCWWANWCTLQCLTARLQQPQGRTLHLWEVRDLLSCVISHFSLFFTSGGLCRATCLTGTQVTGTVSTFLSFTASRRSHDKQSLAGHWRWELNNIKITVQISFSPATGDLNSTSPGNVLHWKHPHSVQRPQRSTWI